jgi:CheY-like chemotaxis protein
MDVEMPVMDGYQATAEIRRFERSFRNDTGSPATPVLALTAHAFAKMAVKGIEAGFTAVLTKPIRKVTLLEALVEHGPGKSGARITGAMEQAKNVVPVEEGMEDVVPGYLEKRRREVPVYAEALERDDFEAIRQLAHKMKGTGSGYGFPVLTELGGLMEKAAMDNHSAQIREFLDRLALYLESVELKYIR